uniref:Uncharacterized protein n=1 Tax=Sciurus vulgaris TaxID=55149 RepID=A0A8D2DMC7_SCIVU
IIRKVPWFTATEILLCYRGRLLPRLLFSPQKPRIYFPAAGRVVMYRTSVTSAKVSVNGVHLHYQQTGEGEHAVLLLPVMLGCGENDFAPQLKNLSKKLFTVVAWDPQEYGHSRPPDRDFQVDSFERDAKDAVDLMKMLKFKKVSLWAWVQNPALPSPSCVTLDKILNSPGPEHPHLPTGDNSRTLLTALLFGSNGAPWVKRWAQGLGRETTKKN